MMSHREPKGREDRTEIKKRVIAGLIVAAYAMGVSPHMLATAAAATDPFTGSHALTLYGDSNIMDGFVLGTRTADCLVSTNDGFHYTTLVNSGVLSLPMVRSGNQLSLNPWPQGTTIHSYMLSDGAVGAFLLMEQGNNGSESIGIRLATWAPDTTVLGSQLAGDWEMTSIGDDNLRSDPERPFEASSETWAIFDLGDGLVEVYLKGHNVIWRMQITGNALVPLPETLTSTPSIVHVAIVTDGNTLAMSRIGVETSDNTDVSATVGLATRPGAGSSSSSCQCSVSTCGELQLAVGNDSSNPIHFYLLDTPGPFKIVHGIYQPIPTASDPDDKPVLFSGTGQVADMKVDSESHAVFLMNLHSSQEHADQSPQPYWHDGRIVQASLDLSTLKGTVWSVGTDYDATDDEYGSCFDKYDVSLVGQLPACLKQ
jgi:hypothetical protein